MAAINSKIDICNMALGHMGNKSSINNIDTPTTAIEKTFALWYDVTIEVALKMLMPNFALARKKIARLVYTAPFGFQFAYEYPNDVLKILGISDIQEKENNYTIEDGRILTDTEYTDGLPIRYIKNVTDVTKFSPEVKILASWLLAQNTVISVTQDRSKLVSINETLPVIMASVGAVNAQENKPIRKSTSNFKKARYQPSPTTGIKK